MRVSFSFVFTRDLSSLSHGVEFLSIIHSHGLKPEKAGRFEPIRESFVASDLPNYWDLRSSYGSNSAYSDFMFRGSEDVKFMGMVSCHTDFHPDSKAVNGVHLWLTVRKTYDINKLVLLGDDLFVWSEAVYGYVTDSNKDFIKIFIQKERSQVNIDSVSDGISGLMWLNYFGKPYLAEREFHLPDGHVNVGHGSRVRLSERPDDEVLSDLSYTKMHQEKIGSQWFCPLDKIENGIGYLPENYRRADIKSPVFDRTEITRKQETPEDF